MQPDASLRNDLRSGWAAASRPSKRPHNPWQQGSTRGEPPRFTRLAANLDANPSAAGAMTAILVVDDERALSMLMSGYVGAADTAGAQGGMLRILPKPFHAAGCSAP